MEGVEDIPGSALAEGITWQWESFPEYLDAIEKRDLAVDFGTQIAHGAVRGYAMGERGARNEEATDDDIAAMAPNRPGGHRGRRAWLLHVTHRGAPRHRRRGGAGHLRRRSRNCSAWAGRWPRAAGRCSRWRRRARPARDPAEAAMRELDWMTRLAAEIERPVSFTMIQTPGAPDLWREHARPGGQGARRTASRLYAQIAARPFGMLFGFPGYHAFTHRPTYRKLKAELEPRGVGAAPRRPGGARGDPGRGRPARRTRCRCSTRMFATDPAQRRPHLRHRRPARLRADAGPDRRGDRRAAAARTRWPRCTT